MVFRFPDAADGPKPKGRKRDFPLGLMILTEAKRDKRVSLKTRNSNDHVHGPYGQNNIIPVGSR